MNNQLYSKERDINCFGGGMAGDRMAKQDKTILRQNKDWTNLKLFTSDLARIDIIKLRTVVSFHQQNFHVERSNPLRCRSPLRDYRSYMRV